MSLQTSWRPVKSMASALMDAVGRLLCVEHVEEHNKPVLYLVCTDDPR